MDIGVPINIKVCAGIIIEIVGIGPCLSLRDIRITVEVPIRTGVVGVIVWVSAGRYLCGIGVAVAVGVRVRAGVVTWIIGISASG